MSHFKGVAGSFSGDKAGWWYTSTGRWLTPALAVGATVPAVQAEAASALLRMSVL
jgi:hypothetical protein